MSSEHPDLQDLIWMMDFVDIKPMPSLPFSWHGASTTFQHDDIEHVYENMEVIESIMIGRMRPAKTVGILKNRMVGIQSTILIGNEWAMICSWIITNSMAVIHTPSTVWREMMIVVEMGE